MLYVIDPGLHNCGFSRWTHDGKLDVARLLKNPVQVTNAGALNARPMAMELQRWIQKAYTNGTDDNLVIEVPQVYTRARSKGDPNDLIDLACVVGAIMGVHNWRQVFVYRPAQWKGQQPKEVTTRNAQNDLRPEELTRVTHCAASLMHNVWDAVALGLAHLKKVGQRPLPMVKMTGLPPLGAVSP